AAELDGAIAELPLTEEEQSYLVLLSQRMATPSRGGMVIDSATPVRAMRSVEGATPTPTTARASTGLVTPPSESRPIARPPTVSAESAAGAASTAESPPTLERGADAPPARIVTPAAPHAAYEPEPVAADGGDAGAPRGRRRLV